MTEFLMAAYVVIGMLGAGLFIVKSEGYITAADLLIILVGWPIGPIFLLALACMRLSEVVIWRCK